MLAVALVARLPLLVAVGLMVLATGIASNQLAALGQGQSQVQDQGQSQSQAAATDISANTLIVANPEWRRGALVAQVRVSDTGQRWEAWARGPVAYRFEDALVGEHWHVSGTASVADENSGRYLWPRHLVGRMQITQANLVDNGNAAFVVANSLINTIEASAKSLSQRDRALLAGFVYGDDRDQLPEVLHDFRATSLTHLLAVSGSNVAFVLLLVAPLLVRLKLWWRLVAVAVLLAEFALITRAEPSVLRACVLATLAVGAQAVGRSSSAKRLLALTVIVLVVVDPLLIHAAGFQLSVAAAAGIVLGAGHIERRLRGPRWLRLALAVTLAAQLGVLPVQLWLFGSLPLVSVPANILAGPMAGPAMIWGLLAGIVGGLAGDAVAAVLHLPTKVMVGWVAVVARYAAGWRWPTIEPRELVPLTVLAGATFVVFRWIARWRARTPMPSAPLRLAHLAIVPLALGGVWLVADSHRPEFADTVHLKVIGGAGEIGGATGTASTAAGATGGFTAIAVDRPDAAWVLDRLAASGIGGREGEIDLLVALSSSRAGREAVRVIQSRFKVAELWTPPGFGYSSAGSGNATKSGDATRHRVINEPTSVGELAAAAGSGVRGALSVVAPSGESRLALVAAA